MLMYYIIIIYRTDDTRYNTVGIIIIWFSMIISFDILQIFFFVERVSFIELPMMAANTPLYRETMDRILTIYVYMHVSYTHICIIVYTYIYKIIYALNSLNVNNTYIIDVVMVTAMMTATTTMTICEPVAADEIQNGCE
jgi:hypothetical protein